jgi:flagellin-like protein
MELNKLFTDDRAVSPVVGVALLIAIAVILAAVIGVVVLGLGTTGADTPQAQLNGEFLDDNSYELRHRGGDPLDSDNIVIRYNGNEDPLPQDLRAGDSISDNTTSDVTEGDEVSIIWEDPNSDSETVLKTFEVEAAS